LSPRSNFALTDIGTAQVKKVVSDPVAGSLRRIPAIATLDA
jgi:hypothetical protein